MYFSIGDVLENIIVSGNYFIVCNPTNIVFLIVMLMKIKFSISGFCAIIIIALKGYFFETFLVIMFGAFLNVLMLFIFL